MTPTLTEFKHPLILTMLMFAGEAILLLGLKVQLARDPSAAASHQKHQLNPLIIAAPALLGTIGSFLSFTGLALISASTYQVLKMLCMLFTVLLSVTVLNRRYTFLQYLAIFSVMAGLLIVTYISTSQSDTTSQDGM